MFHNENDVLEIRFQELDPVVDMFVVVQGSHTFRGKPKSNAFSEHRFNRYLDKIIFINVDLEHLKDSVSWDIEKFQRNAISHGLASAHPDDIIIVSDADEIPRRECVAAADPVGVDAWMMQVFIGGINVLAPNRHTIRFCRFKDFTTAQEIRKAPLEHVIERGGWEFSSLMTPEDISRKLQSFSHYELDKPEITNPKAIRERMERGEDPYGFGLKYERVSVDDTWPHAIKENRAQWKRFEWEE